MSAMLLRRLSFAGTAMIALSCAIALVQPSLLSTQVIAQTPTNLPRQNQGKAGGWLKDLNLTPEQMQQIKQIRSQSKNNDLKQKRQAINQAQQELQNLMAGNASKQQVRDKYNQIKTLKQQLADTQFENTLAIREVLNSQQRQKFVEHLYKRSPNTRNQQK